MVLAVILTVIVLALVASGYWLNNNLEVERQGMLQINSSPTGATVTVDGAAWSWLDRTNASKVLSAGEHTVTLTKDGYDSWSRTIKISEGLLYRVQYPRLFLTEREVAAVYDLTDYNFATASPDGAYLLLAGKTTEWLLLNLERENLEPRTVDVATVFSTVSVAEGAATGLFTGEIVSADWSRDHNHVLLQVRSEAGVVEWALLDPKTPRNNVNLTKTFARDFSEVQIMDDSAANLLVMQEGNLRKIDVSGRQISAVLAEKVLNFDHFGSEIVFVAEKTAEMDAISSVFSVASDAISGVSDGENAISSVSEDADAISSVPEGADATSSVAPYYLGLVRVGDSKPTVVLPLERPAKAVISKFYDDYYLTVLSDTEVKVYYKNDVAEVLQEYELGFAPATMAVGQDGEFVQMTAGVQMATLDMEAQAVREWEIAGKHYDRLDRGMLYAVSEGELTVYDFDGLNARVLTSSASEHFPVAIAGEKWLYYASDYRLMRMKIAN